MRRLDSIFLWFCLVALAVQGVMIAEHRSIVLDEAVTLLHSFKAASGDWSQLAADIHMPVYNVLVALWMKIVGFEIFRAKLLSVAAGVAAVWMTYRFVDRNADKRSAQIAVFLMAFSPIFLQYAQLARSYSLFVALSIVSSFFYFESLKAGFRLRSRATLWFVLSTFALMATHMVGAGLLVVQTLHALFMARKRRVSFLAWWKIAPLPVLLYVPIAATILNRYDLKSAIPVIYSWVALPDWGDLVQSVGYSFEDPSVIVAAFAFFVTIAYFRRSKGDAFVCYLLLWLLVPSLLLFAYSHFHHPIFIRRGLAPSIVPLVTLMAFGVAKSGFVLRTVGRIAVIAIAWWGLNVNVDRAEIQEEAWEDLTEAIRASRKEFGGPHMGFYLRPGYAWRPFLYYFDRECFFSDDPEACARAKRVAMHGADSLDGGTPFAPVNWFIGYGSEATKNRELIEAFKKSGGSSRIVEHPELRGFDAILFTHP